jgi:hypothetical protein
MSIETRVADFDVGRYRALARPSELPTLAVVINHKSAMVEFLQAAPHEAA